MSAYINNVCWKTAIVNILSMIELGEKTIIGTVPATDTYFSGKVVNGHENVAAEK